MEPLKRFTQCGSLTMLFTVFIILFGVSSTALTTFGKSPQNPAPQTPNAARPIECISHDNCNSIPRTSCVVDSISGDGKTRCVCGDNKWPDNGKCSKSKKQLRHICVNGEDCDDGMLCAYDVNATKSYGQNRNQNQFQICLCNNDDGYYEDKDDNTCNESGRLVSGIFVPLISMIVGILISRKQSNY